MHVASGKCARAGWANGSAFRHSKSFCVILGPCGTETVAVWFNLEISSIAVLMLTRVEAPGVLLGPGRQRQAAGGGCVG